MVQVSRKSGSPVHPFAGHEPSNLRSALVKTAPGIATRNTKLAGAPGLTTRSKEATNGAPGRTTSNKKLLVAK